MPQININFNRVTEQGLKPIINKFGKKGMAIASVEATNSPKRESGFLTKSAIINFETGQKLLIRIKQDGTIFQVKLNGTVLPVKNVDNLDKAIDEVIDHVKSNETRYLKAKQKRLEKQKIKIDQPKARTTRKQELDIAESRIAELETERDGLQTQINTLQEGVNTKTGQLDELTSKLEDLKERGEELQTELDELKAEAA